MLKDCIEILKEKEKNYNGENPICFYTDSYLLDNGVYFVVDLKTSKYEKIVVKLVKKENKNEYEPLNSELYEKIKIFDFLSKPITPRIKIDSKRCIGTTNCFSIGFQKEKLENINKNNLWEQYFQKTKKMLINSKYCSELKEYERYNDKFINISKQIVEENYLDTKITDNDFIKIYADLPFEKYLLLKDIYYDNYAYLSEKDNYECQIREKRENGNKIPANFVSLNDKKPFNANKTRKVPAICYENEEERINRDSLSKYLMLPNKLEEFDDRYIVVRNDKEKGFGFEQYDVIPRNISTISFNYDNYLELDFQVKISNHIDKLEDLIKSLYRFASKNDDKNQKGSEKWSIFLSYLDLWNNTGNFIPLKKQIDLICLTLIQNKIILDEEYVNAQIQFNIYESLKTYFIIQDNNHKSQETIDKIRESRKGFFMALYELIVGKIKGEETKSIDDDEEFFFIAGQITKYLVFKSKTDNITDAIASGVLCSQKTDYLIKEVLKLYEKYMHAIKVLKYKNTEFSNLCAMFLKYTPKSKFVDKRMLLAGYLHSSVIKIPNVNSDEQQESEEI